MAGWPRAGTLRRWGGVGTALADGGRGVQRPRPSCSWRPWELRRLGWWNEAWGSCHLPKDTLGGGLAAPALSPSSSTWSVHARPRTLGASVRTAAQPADCPEPCPSQPGALPLDNAAGQDGESGLHSVTALSPGRCARAGLVKPADPSPAGSSPLRGGGGARTGVEALRPRACQLTSWRLGSPRSEGGDDTHVARSLGE